MNTFLPLLLFVAALPAADAPAPADQGPTRGNVLVLANEHTLVGDIERVGDLYRVRRLIGQTTVPADRVLRLCPGMVEAYEFLRGRANLTDPDERLRLAEWCRLNGLHEQALDEVKAAVDLRPDDPGSRRLLSYLQESGPAKPAPAKPRPEDDPAAPKLAVDLTEESLGQFATKVQPILMNVCANCHANSHGGAFRLTRAYDTAVLNRKTLQQNLAAVLSEVNPDQPRSSPLLAKAVSVHGPLEQAPIKNRQAPAYRTLEDWVKATLADNPQLYSRPAAASAPAGTSPFAEVRPGAAEDPVWADEGPRPSPSPSAPFAVRATAPLVAPDAVKAPPEPSDPYSPDAFNRQFHADATKPGTEAKPKP